MSKEEIKKELGMSYQGLVDYLLEKYGPAQYDYFINDSFRSKNKKVSRSAEGLECHHIDEDKAIMLSSPQYAARNPFEYQKAERLVYCNVLEHLILHIKIVEEPRPLEANEMELPGIGGIINFLCPQINDYYNGYEYKREHQIRKFEKIADNFDDYIGVLNYLLGIVDKRPDLALLVTRERISRGYDNQMIRKIYDLL